MDSSSTGASVSGGGLFMSEIHHVVPAIDAANGVWRVATLLAARDGGEVCERLEPPDNNGVVWVHGMWLPRLWQASHVALKNVCKLVRMTHGSLSPIYLKQQNPLQKRLVAPIERYFLRRAEKVVATCEAEAEWIRAFEPRVKNVEIIDIKQFFDLSRKERKCRKDGEPLHLLYLGRRHPLKGVEYLETAVAELNSNPVDPVNSVQNSSLHLSTSTRLKVELRIVSSAFGEELEKVWQWCDVLVLPTLSENFGLVVAEALERGKRVITTDGAPAWGDDCKCQIENAKCKISGGEILTGYSGRLLYLKGYRDGTEDERVRLLKCAITFLVSDFASR